MDKKRAIELLKQKRNEAVTVASLPYNNNEYIPWRRNIEDILESTFGINSTEYKRVANRKSTTVRGTHAELQRAYKQLIHRIQLEVSSIIQKHEIFESEAEPAPKTESKNKVESPLEIFDAMQFHPKVVDASRPCFTTVNYREAILNAFISLIDYIKEISGLDLDGDDLMNNAFSFNYDREHRKITKYPIIRISELKNRTDRDEQQGFMFLCKGAAAFVRNPKAHRLIIQTDPLHTLEYLALASMLFKQLDKRVQIRHKEQTS